MGSSDGICSRSEDSGQPAHSLAASFFQPSNLALHNNESQLPIWHSWPAAVHWRLSLPIRQPYIQRPERSRLTQASCSLSGLLSGQYNSVGAGWQSKRSHLDEGCGFIGGGNSEYGPGYGVIVTCIHQSPCTERMIPDVHFCRPDVNRSRPLRAGGRLGPGTFGPSDVDGRRPFQGVLDSDAEHAQRATDFPDHPWLALQSRGWACVCICESCSIDIDLYQASPRLAGPTPSHQVVVCPNPMPQS